jgi:hypothetical protein
MKIRIKIKKTFSLTKNVTQSHSIHNWCDIFKKKTKNTAPHFSLFYHYPYQFRIQTHLF